MSQLIERLWDSFQKRNVTIMTIILIMMPVSLLIPNEVQHFFKLIVSLLPEAIFQYFNSIQINEMIIVDTLKMFLLIQSIPLLYIILSQWKMLPHFTEMYNLFDAITGIILYSLLTLQLLMNLNYLPGNVVLIYADKFFDGFFDALYLIPLYINLIFLASIIIGYFWKTE